MNIAAIGHNNPPSAIYTARSAYGALSEWLDAHPVIQSHDDATEAKGVLDRMKATLGDLSAARDAEAKPHYAAWQDALAKFKPASDSLTKLTDELKRRIGDYIRAEEMRRAQEAAAARQAAEEAAARARAAIEAEREAAENATMGEVGAGLGAASLDADDAIAAAKRAEREAAVAERDAATVRVGGGWGRVASLRTKETLVVSDAAKAIKAIGMTDKIRDAILSSARDYRKLKGKLPAGIDATTERAL